MAPPDAAADLGSCARGLEHERGQPDGQAPEEPGDPVRGHVEECIHDRPVGHRHRHAGPPAGLSAAHLDRAGRPRQSRGWQRTRRARRVFSRRPPGIISRSQPFFSDGAFKRRQPLLDLANPALELFERAGHVQQPLNEVIREGFEGLGDRSSSPPRCLLSDHAEILSSGAESGASRAPASIMA